MNCKSDVADLRKKQIGPIEKKKTTKIKILSQHFDSRLDFIEERIGESENKRKSSKCCTEKDCFRPTETESKKYTYIHRTRFFRKDSLMIIRMRSPTVYHLPAGGGPGKPVVSFQSKSKGLRTRELMG